MCSVNCPVRILAMESSAVAARIAASCRFLLLLRRFADDVDPGDRRDRDIAVDRLLLRPSHGGVEWVAVLQEQNNAVEEGDASDRALKQTEGADTAVVHDSP